MVIYLYIAIAIAFISGLRKFVYSSIHNISHVSPSRRQQVDTDEVTRYCGVTLFDQSTNYRSNGYRHCHFFCHFVRWPHHSFQANQPKNKQSIISSYMILTNSVISKISEYKLQFKLNIHTPSK